MKPKLHVIVASTRPGRLGPTIAKWFADTATKHGAFEVSLVDLASFQLPVYDEPVHPRLQQYEHAHTKAWSASVAAADAYVFVTPEYNYAPPGALVNALNFLYTEWTYKVAGVVSYGGVSGGLRAAQVLKSMASVLKLVTPPEGVAIPNFGSHLDANKVFVADDLHTQSAQSLLDEMAKWDKGLKVIRG